MLKIISWLERRFVNLIFSDDDPRCDVDETRVILDETDANKNEI